MKQGITIKKREKLCALDGMRGLADLAVVLFHAHPFFEYQIVPGGLCLLLARRFVGSVSLKEVVS